MNPLDFLQSVFKPAADLVDSLHTSTEEKMVLKAKMFEAQTALALKVIEYEKTLIEQQSSVIQAEAKGESWIQRSWRPIVMLAFAGLIVARWMGFAAPNLSEALELALFDIIKIGLGGYVIGRSGEKIASAVAETMAKK